MSFLMKIILCFAVNFALVATCLSQDKNNKIVVKSIQTQLEKILHYKYYVHILDIDRSVNNPTVAKGRIKNPYGTLNGCIIFLASAPRDSNFFKPKGFIGVYKTDSILWRSDLLTEDFSNLSGEVSAVDELNKDGKVEIVISQYSQRDGTWEYLWIFNWDGKNGNLITNLDDEGESTITCIGDFQLKDLDKDGIYEIQCEWCKNSNFDNTYSVRYSWNGSLYSNWGKTSKYFLKGKKK